MPPVLFALVILEIGSCFIAKLDPWSSYFNLHTMAGMTGRYYSTQMLSIEMGSPVNLLPIPQSWTGLQPQSSWSQSPK
jgi:hypothetical protein